MEIRTEIRYCLDCGMVGQITKHGRCGTCNSDAVVLPVHSQAFEPKREKDVEILEEMLRR